MTVPRELQLHKTADGYRLQSRPVRELERLRTATATLPPRTFRGMADLSDDIRFPITTSEVLLKFDLGRTTAQSFGVTLSNDRGEVYRLGFDRATGRFTSDRTQSGPAAFSDKFLRVHSAPRAAAGDRLRLRIYFDVASAELFADDGATVLTDVFFPSTAFTRMALHAEGGVAALTQGAVHRIGSVWASSSMPLSQQPAGGQ